MHIKKTLVDVTSIDDEGRTYFLGQEYAKTLTLDMVGLHNECFDEVVINGVSYIPATEELN